MQKRERRKFERVSSGELPETFKVLYVDVGHIKNLKAETVDVSTTGVGMRLVLPRGAHRRERRIEVRSADNGSDFNGEIVHIERLDEDEYRVGAVLRYPA